MIQLYHTTAWTCCWRWAAKDEYVPNQVQPLVQSPARGERFGPRLCTAGTCQVWGCLPPPPVSGVLGCHSERRVIDAGLGQGDHEKRNAATGGDVLGCG